MGNLSWPEDENEKTMSTANGRNRNNSSSPT